MIRVLVLELLRGVRQETAQPVGGRLPLSPAQPVDPDHRPVESCLPKTAQPRTHLRLVPCLNDCLPASRVRCGARSKPLPRVVLPPSSLPLPRNPPRITRQHQDGKAVGPGTYIGTQRSFARHTLLRPRTAALRPGWCATRHAADPQSPDASRPARCRRASCPHRDTHARPPAPSFRGSRTSHGAIVRPGDCDVRSASMPLVRNTIRGCELQERSPLPTSRLRRYQARRSRLRCPWGCPRWRRSSKAR